MIRITSGKGFKLTFENGVTISVQFGLGNYCENRSFNLYFDEWAEREREAGERGCENAEIAIWRGDDWYNFGTDTVKGWVSPNEIAGWILWASLIPEDVPMEDLPPYVELPDEWDVTDQLPAGG